MHFVCRAQLDLSKERSRWWHRHGEHPQHIDFNYIGLSLKHIIPIIKITDLDYNVNLLILWIKIWPHKKKHIIFVTLNNTKTYAK